MDERIQPEPAPVHVQELAATCSRLVEKGTGVPLDLSPDTLPLLDHYLRQLVTEPDEARNLVATAAGAYFGEVVRNRFPCRWHAPPLDYGTWRIEFEHVFLHFNPVAFAHEAITLEEVVEGGTGFGVLDADLDAVRDGLEALGTISEEDYFRLATRFEVLTTVIDRLTGASIAANDPAVSFDAETYRVALDGEQSNSTS